MSAEAESRALAIAALVERPAAGQLRTPLDYIFAEHFRQRSLCRILAELAEASSLDREMAAAALGFLRTDFALHVADEEEDLFPLLRRRQHRQDRMGDILGQLSAQHATDGIDAGRIETALAAALEAETPSPLDAEARDTMLRFAASERRHLITENAIVLPLARARLSAADLEALGRSMAARRGIAYPGDADAV